MFNQWPLLLYKILAILSFFFHFFQSQEEALLKASIEADIKSAEDKRKTMFEEIENAALQKRKEKENLINDLVNFINIWAFLAKDYD